MTEYIINVTNSSSQTGTIFPDVGFSYTDNLNEMNEATIKLSGTGTVMRGLLAEGSLVEIKKGGTRVFYGLVDYIDYLDAGGVVFHVAGYETWLAKENGAYANSPWTSPTNSQTIFSEIIAESNYFSVGPINAGIVIDFRLEVTESLWNGMSNLARKTGQDINIDYINSEVDILDHKGSSSVVATLNDGLEISNVRVTKSYPAGNYVKVYGKGDGANQIKSTSAAGQDATSQASYGIITRPIIDRSIISVAEANILADAEVALTKDPRKVIDFTVKDFAISLVAGDHVYVNSPDKDLSNEEVRIVGIRRGMEGNREFMEMQVTNPAYKTLSKKRDRLLAKIQKDSRDATTYMQGSTINSVWASGINAKTSYPLKVGFYVSSTFEDEAGNLNVNNMVVDYDVDPFNQQFGSASFTGSDPQVQNTSANTQPGVSGTSAVGGGTTVIAASDSNGGATAVANGGWTKIWDMGVITGNDTSALHVLISGGDDDNVTYPPVSEKGIRYRVKVGGNYYPDSTGVTSGVDSLMQTVLLIVPVDIINADCELEAFGIIAGINLNWRANYFVLGRHSHADGSYVAADHGHPNGSYDVNAADLDYVSIADGVGEAGSVNASSVNLYLDFWNGSSWVNKHTISGTGKTLDNDVDITNSGTYPDATGYWRVRIEPITANADFVQGKVRLKYHIDS